jgi:ABC-2 type transport system ATP-binding protein
VTPPGQGRRAVRLEAHDLHRSFGDLGVLRGVSFSVGAGEVYALLGPNGAGKTTTFRIILGLLRADRGEVLIDRSALSDHRRILMRKVGFLLEQPRMIPELSLEQNLIFSGSIHRLTRLGERVDAMIAGLGMEEWRGLPLSRYSRGMSQKAALGRALLHDPAILVLDEPLAGLDPISQEEFRSTIERLRCEGKALLVASHDLSEMETLCTHLGMLQHGRLVVSGPIGQIRGRSRWKKIRLTWTDSARTRDASTFLERCFCVRSDPADRLSLLVILPRGLDHRAILRQLPCVCRQPTATAEVSITLEDIFLAEMQDQRKPEADRG